MGEVTATISQINVTGTIAQLEDVVGTIAQTKVEGTIARKVMIAGPAFVSAEIGDEDNKKLVITFGAALNESVVPATTAFTTSGIAGTPSVSSVSISGTEVTLTLSADATLGDTITVTYVVPTYNPLQDSDGMPTAAFTGESVTNNVAAGPAFVSAEIGDVGNDKLVMTFDAAFNESITPATAAFSTSGITGSPSISSVAVSGVTVTLTLSGDATSGDTILVSYTQPASNPLQNASRDKSVSFTDESVTDNVASAYGAEYQAIYDAYVNDPGDANALIDDTMVTGWVADGVWAKLDGIWVLANHITGSRLFKKLENSCQYSHSIQLPCLRSVGRIYR